MLMLLLSASFVVSLANTFGNKKLQTIFPKGNVAYAFYAFITGAVSTVNFLIMTKFSPVINLRVIAFALFYAVICRISYVVTFKSLKYNGVFMNNIFSRVGSIIPPIIISGLFLGEQQGLGTILGGICVIAAGILPGASQEGKNTKKAGLLWATAILAIGTVTTMSTKLFVALEGVENTLSYNLMTNVFISVTSVFSFVNEVRKGGGVSEIFAFKKEHYLLTFVVATTSNLGAYVGRFMLELVGVIPNAVISGSVGMLVTVAVSLYFGEKLTKRRFVSVVLSIASAILPVVMT